MTLSPLLTLAFGVTLASTSPSLTPVSVLALPAAVETAAWAVPGPGELRVLINRPGRGETLQLRVHKDRRIEQLPPLPLVAAGATRCGQELVIAGSDRQGKPMALGVTDTGAVAWQVAIPGPKPTRWPVPGCAPAPVLTWQTTPGKLELAQVGPGGLTGQRTVPVGGPPLEVATHGSSIWAAWSDASGLHVSEITARDVRSIQVPVPSPGQIALGPCPEGLRVAWTRGPSAFISTIGPGAAPGSPSVAMDLSDAAGGSLAVVPGPEPLVFAQRAHVVEGEVPRWSSALVVPGKKAFLIEGIVHAVASWEEHVVVVGATELRLLAQPGQRSRTPAAKPSK